MENTVTALSGRTAAAQLPASLSQARELGLSEEEFQKICDILGHIPNITELAVYAAMWSEHCSYKNSIIELKTLPRSGDRLLAQAGEENAGLVDIGDGWAVAFKIESHNHPSAVEPFQGAATGVGGILRDIFTMGARPLVVLDSLRFGDLSQSRTRYLLDGVVRGIAHYGNCFGVPTAGGEVQFDSSYNGNPLVNVMAVGVVEHKRIARARAHGPGNSVIYVGSRTGRDGIHGATFASEELSLDNEAKRPAVQVGDPFAEKLLLEATLDLAGRECLIAIQDMGAAGLTCSSCEMAGNGGVGMDIDLDRVPLREADMEPWEILLSESQERMLLVGKAGCEDEILNIFRRWDLEAVVVGEVTDSGRMRYFKGGECVVDVPAASLILGGGAPQYRRESKHPEELDHRIQLNPEEVPEPDDPGAVLCRLLSDPDVASKRWIFEQYDQSVRTNTVLEPGRADAAVIRVEGTNKGLAVCTDGNGRYVALNPRRGAQLAVAEAARNVACVGAKPVAITNCLNFGNPYKPEGYYFFREAVAGMGEACRELGTPVTGGNVSFYNETNNEAVIPTPVIGMLGVLEDVRYRVGGWFAGAGRSLILLGSPTGWGLGGSIYLRQMTGMMRGEPAPVDFNAERRLIELLNQLARKGLIESAHDVSDGGLAVTIAECCLWAPLDRVGAVIDYPHHDSVADHLFGEAPGRAIVSVSAANEAAVFNLSAEYNVPAVNIGFTGGDRFEWRGLFHLPLSILAECYYNSLPRLMNEAPD